MISAGNDIVALKSIDVRRTKQVRFYSKILTDSELELYNRKKFPALPFENFVWLLWTVKESVYKYQKRNNPLLLFSPKKIIIQNIDLPKNQSVTDFGRGQHEEVSLYEENVCSCTILFESNVFYSKSAIYNELIYTLVNNDDNFETTWWGIKFIEHTDYINQSKDVRSFVLNKLYSIFPNHNLQIGKSASGCPLLLKETNEMTIPISFTHHDHFIAYSFLYENYKTA